MTDPELIQLHTIGDLSEQLYFRGVIGIHDVRTMLYKTSRRKNGVAEQQAIEEGMSAVMRGILQAGIGENGSFEGVTK